MIDPTIFNRLAAAFPQDEVGWKPGPVKGNRALAVPYLNARAVMDRLDKVLTVAGWQDQYDFLADGSCTCTLRCRFAPDGEWITKVDVGGPSAQPDAGDRRKSAVSDALKRAAVKFGVGRYLHRLPPIWADYDQQRKCFTGTPRLPDWALPPACKPVLPAINDEQARELAGLLQETHTDPERFCRHYGIDEAQCLPLSRFDEAVTTLRRKLPAATPA